MASHILEGDEETKGMMAQVDRNRTQFYRPGSDVPVSRRGASWDSWYVSVIVGMPGHFVAKAVISHEPLWSHAAVLRITGSLNS